MEYTQWKARKVVIIGAGQVGATSAYALAQNGLTDEIAIADLNGEYDLKDVSLSVPCIVSQEGVTRMIETSLPQNKQNTLEASAK